MNGHISHLCFWQPQCFLEFRREPRIGLVVHRKGLGLVLAYCLSHKELFWSSITPGLGSRGWVGSNPLYWPHHPGQYIDVLGSEQPQEHPRGMRGCFFRWESGPTIQRNSDANLPLRSTRKCPLETAAYVCRPFHGQYWLAQFHRITWFWMLL